MALSLAARMAQLARYLSNGPAVVLPWELIEQKSPVAAQTEIDFTNFPAGFDCYWLEIDGIGVVTNDTSVVLRFRAGGVWQTTNYQFGIQTFGPTGAASGGSGVDAFTGGISLSRVNSAASGTGNGVGNVAGASLSATVKFNAKATPRYRAVRFESQYLRNDGVSVGAVGQGQWSSDGPIDGIRIYSGSPQFKAQGTVKLFGLRI